MEVTRRTGVDLPDLVAAVSSVSKFTYYTEYPLDVASKRIAEDLRESSHFRREHASLLARLGRLVEGKSLVDNPEISIKQAELAELRAKANELLKMVTELEGDSR